MTHPNITSNPPRPIWILNSKIWNRSGTHPSPRNSKSAKPNKPDLRQRFKMNAYGISVALIGEITKRGWFSRAPDESALRQSLALPSQIGHSSSRPKSECGIQNSLRVWSLNPRADIYPTGWINGFRSRSDTWWRGRRDLIGWSASRPVDLNRPIGYRVPIARPGVKRVASPRAAWHCDVATVMRLYTVMGWAFWPNIWGLVDRVSALLSALRAQSTSADVGPTTKGVPPSKNCQRR